MKNSLQDDYTNEAVRYNVSGTSEITSVADVLEHKFTGAAFAGHAKIFRHFRFGNASNTKVSLESKRGFVLGNYNAYGIVRSARRLCR